MAKVDIIALGGLDEIHNNLYLLEIDAKLFILDAGMYEPLSSNFGIKHFIPSLEYIEQMKDRVKAIFLSSGNKLEIGAITELMKIVPNLPIHASKETIKYIELLYDQTSKWNLIEAKNGEIISYSEIDIEPRMVASSIPGTMSWIFNTEDGEIIYSVNNIFDTITQFKDDTSTWAPFNKPLLYLIDSSNMNLDTSVAPAYKIKKRVEESFKEHETRTIIAVYEDEFINIVEMIELSKKYDRPISIINKRMFEYIDWLMKEKIIISYPIKLGLQNIKNEVIIFSETRTNLFNNFMELLTEDNDKILKIEEEDLVIMASPAQSGNEHVYAKVQSELARHQSEVIEFTSTNKPRVHPSQFDLSNYLKRINPKYIMPIKGYYKEMIKTIPIALESNIPAENVIIADNGDRITIKDGKLIGDVEKIKVGISIINDATKEEINSTIINERQNLASQGLVTIAFLLDKKTKDFLSDIDVQMKGVVFIKTQDRLFDEIRGEIKKIVNNGKESFKINQIVSAIKKENVKLIKKYTKKSPSIIIEVHEI